MMISNLTRRGFGAGIGALLSRLWGRTNREVRQIVGHHQENLAL
jgi:hypothetical protein